MFDAVRNNKKIVQIILGLIALPFAFFGVDSYMKNSVATDVATVGEAKISVIEFDQAVRDQSDRARRALGDQFNPEMMDSKEVREGILDNLIDKRLIALEIYNQKLMVGKDALVDALKNNPYIQENGKISEAKYRQMLSAYGMSEAQYEATLRQELTMAQLIDSLTESSFVSNAQLDAILKLQTEEREYSEFKVSAASFADKVKIDSADVEKYYNEHKTAFEIPKQVKIEYLVLTPASLVDQVKVSDEEVKTWYDSNKARYDQSERRASHILISNGDDKTKAKAKAEELLKEVKASPEKFAEIATANSQDPGSASKGGDLGFFGRGMMVKPFEEAVFSMKEGDISDLVESDFGYHIIKLTGIKQGQTKSIEDVRPEIVAQLKQQGAQRKYAEMAEIFKDSVSQEFDSLTPTAEKFGLKIQNTDWLFRKLSPAQIEKLGPAANDKVMNAVFSSEATEKKQNIDAIETASNTLVAARVVDYKPVEQKSFDSVKSDIEKTLKDKELAVLTKQAGEEILAKLKTGEDTLKWGAAQKATRLSVQTVDPDALRELFKTDTANLPAYTGYSSGDDYVVYKITKVNIPETFNDDMRKGLQDQYVAILAQEEWTAYLKALRTKYKIKINNELLEKKAQFEE